MTLREIGFESQFKLFELAKKITGEVPAIVDAEDLLIDAASVVKQYCEKTGIPFLPESLTWEPEFKPEWKYWEIVAPRRRRQHRLPEGHGGLRLHGGRRAASSRRCTSSACRYYEKMYEVRLKP